MSVKEISIEELKQKLEQEEAIQLVDVRENEEVAEGMIPQAIHIRMGDIPEKLDAFDQTQEYYIICRSGKRSENVCYFLEDQGYQATNVVGGMLAWTGETKPKL
ncbi:MULTISPECIES: rhodanese-like domain-containing protein [Bacillus]|uniref:Sulfurtransferase n=1 Tax=Bacillus pumilus (strain SAFR-032) TaxID=315750 RepID=A8FGE6_BACP2|nr:rhodanese-like domain-containing protein [Bacillus pumilus]MCP1149685.1 rhodanese-like domain-containing protein [Bacillus sp. 1735sda2]ABV63313.1 sulfurtransferase [Bacillus pumilus SAFR-032]MBC3643126.1 rhodanese-like domain-containing protein [Bacillus pumilus]MBC3645575.1 rhodanese-like domain-containing protein [Bacillus pumilus]MBC3649098.1 rhodanese-like domain-containing protein [Bacillus pumilus]